MLKIFDSIVTYVSFGSFGLIMLLVIHWILVKFKLDSFNGKDKHYIKTRKGYKANWH